MSGQGPSVTSLRWLLSLFFGGLGGLLPFLSLHSRSVGLSLDEARIVSFTAPFIAALGPLIVGPLIDNFYCKKKKKTSDVSFEATSCVRFTLAATIFLSTVFYWLLLSVPPIQQSDARPSEVAFACNGQGAFLVQPRCGPGACYEYGSAIAGPVRISDCAFDCTGAPLPSQNFIKSTDDLLVTEVRSSTGIIETSTAATTSDDAEMSSGEREAAVLGALEPDLDAFFNNPGEKTVDGVDDDEDTPRWEGSEGSGDDESDEWHRRERRKADEATTEEPLPPHICFGNTNKRMCSVYTPNSASMRINVSLKTGFPLTDHCYYPLGGDFSCRVPPHIHPTPEQCRVVCLLEDTSVAGTDFLCAQGSPNAALSFWLYLLFRSLGDMFTAASISLLTAGTLSAVRTGIGREFVGPSIAYGAVAMLMGCTELQAFPPLQRLPWVLPPFTYPLLTYTLFFAASFLLLLFAKKIAIGPPDWWTPSKAVKMRHKAELWGVLLVLLGLGMLWGPYFSHVPWHLEMLDGDEPSLELFIGASACVGAMLSVAFVWNVGDIVDFCGYSNVLIAGYTFYILRYTGLLFIRTPWVLLITGALEVFSLSLVFFSAVLYIRHLVPKCLTFTAQSLGFVAHFCIGNALGCLIAYFTYPAEHAPVMNASANGTMNASVNVTSAVPEQNELQHPYAGLYCGGAIFAAVVATVYFIVYHLCLKKMCLAPNYRNPPEHQPAAMVQGSVRNGTYTPLLVLTNGKDRSSHATPD